MIKFPLNLQITIYAFSEVAELEVYISLQCKWFNKFYMNLHYTIFDENMIACHAFC